MDVTLSALIKDYCKALRMTKKLQKVSGLDKKVVRAFEVLVRHTKRPCPKEQKLWNK